MNSAAATATQAVYGLRMHVLLAFDGSDGARQAAQLVGNLALPAGSSVRVVAVVEPMMVVSSAWTGALPTWSPGLDEELAAQANADLAGIVDGLRRPTLTVEGAVVHGRPGSEIIDQARQLRPDLVVMGSRGRGEIASLVLGSVSAEVVDLADCPVLIARQPGLSRVVVASDGSPSATTAEALIAQWPIFDEVPIRVVTVASDAYAWQVGVMPAVDSSIINDYARDLEGEHRRIAEEAVGRLRAAGRDATSERRRGDPAGEIIDAARAWNADLVVMGSRGRTGLTRFLLGSVVRNVLHASDASVLVVREAVKAPAAQEG